MVGERAGHEHHIGLARWRTRHKPQPLRIVAWEVHLHKLNDAASETDAHEAHRDSRSHGHSSTTNNQAEYRGLLHGLRAALRFRWTNLEVIGDSELIIRQHLNYRPPKNARLLQLYAETRRLADQIGVVRWTHHVRAFNTMADSLANYAMDTRTSSQTLHPTARPGHADIRARLDNDLDPWLPSFLGRHVE